MEQSLAGKANLSAVEQLIATETQERKDADTSLNERIAQRVPIITVHRPSVYYTAKDSSTGVLFVAKTEQLREPETVPVYSANNTLVTSAPQSANDATNKSYVDTKLDTKADKSTIDSMYEIVDE